MPAGYTEAYARRLDAALPLEVREASPGLAFEPGRVIVARAGSHLLARRDGAQVITHLDVRPVGLPHCPAVDVLFSSAAEAWGQGLLAVVLTGMGSDGLEGARAVKARGGRPAEAASSCVVWGMPRAVAEAGLADAQPPLEAMARAILDRM